MTDLVKVLKKTIVPQAIKHHRGVNAAVKEIALRECQQLGLPVDNLDVALQIMASEGSGSQKLGMAELEKVAKRRVYTHRDVLRTLPNGHPDNAWRSPEQLALHVWCELSLTYSALPFDTLLRFVKHAWVSWAEEQKTKPQAHLAWDGKTSLEQFLTYLRGFLGVALQHETADDLERHIRAAASWMWGVKRKNLGMVNPWPFVLTFMGKQNGTGKTVFVENLVKPWGHLIDRKTVPQVVDERHQAATAQQAIVVLDELAGASKADFNAFKRLITASHLNVRQLYASEPGEYQMYASFIATSNAESIAEFWPDPSGIRRWYPLLVTDFRGSVPEVWDSSELWRMVNPEWEQFFGTGDTDAIEVEHKRPDLVASFLTYAGFTIDQSEGAREIHITTQTLYDYYRGFAGNKADIIEVFGRKVRQISGITPIRWRSSTGRPTGYTFWVDTAKLPNERT